MRMIYVTSSLPFGPGEAFIIPELSHLKRRGHDVEVVPMLPRGPVIHDDAQALVPQTRAQPLVSGAILRGALAEFLRAPAAALRAALWLGRSRNPRILAKNLAVLPKALWLAREARKVGAQHIHVHWGATSATMAMIGAELSGVPWSLTVHRWDIEEDNLLGLKARRACFVRAISGLSREMLLRRIGNGNETFVLHVGVEVPEPGARPPAGGSGRVLVAASLREVKGHAHVLDAVRLLKDRGRTVGVDLVGEGPLLEQLGERIRELGLESDVRLWGAISHSSLLEQLAAGTWDVAVLPSIVTPSGEHEAIPVSLMEAMSLGIPVVATRTGAIPELLENGAGVVVAPADPAALADAIDQLLADPDLRSELGRTGRGRIEERFAIEHVVAELERRFLACVATPR